MKPSPSSASSARRAANLLRKQPPPSARPPSSSNDDHGELLLRRAAAAAVARALVVTPALERQRRRPADEGEAADEAPPPPNQHHHQPKDHPAALRSRFGSLVVDAQRTSRFGAAALDFAAEQEEERRRSRLLGAAAETLARADEREQRQLSASCRERDVLAALAEAGLPEAAARAVAGAARRGLVSSNPGVLLSRAVAAAAALERRQDEEEGARLPRGSVARALLAACPSLLNHAPATLAVHLDALAGLFASFSSAAASSTPPSEAAAAAVLRCPPLLTAPPFRVWVAMEALAEALAAHDHDHDDEDNNNNATAAAPGRRAALAAAARHPRLLTLSPGAIARRAASLRDLLSSSSASRKCPALLLYRPDVLASKLASLGEAAFGGSAPAAAAAAARHPQLLTLDPSKLGLRVAALQEALGAGEDGGRAAARLQPSLLAAAAGGLGRRLASLASAVREAGLLVDQEEDSCDAYARRMAAGAPAVLTLSEATVRRRVRRLAALARVGAGEDDDDDGASSSLSSCWAAQLRSLSPASVGLMLCLSERRLERLSAVRRAYGRGGRAQGAGGNKRGGRPPALRAVVLASDAAFAARWPEAAVVEDEVEDPSRGKVTCR